MGWCVFVHSINWVANFDVYTPVPHHVIIILTELCNALICLYQLLCRLSQPWPQLVPVQCHGLIPEVHDTLIVSAGDRPKLAILLQHYHLPSPNHGLIKVVGRGSRVQRGRVN